MLFLSILLISNNSPVTTLFDSVYLRYRPLTESTMTVAVPAETVRSEGELFMNGTKFFSVNVDRSGGGFEQGLNVNFSGRIAGARVEGNFSDQGVPAETKGITEIDKMRFGVYTETFGAELGDLDIVYPFGLSRSMAGGLGFVRAEPGKARITYGQSKGYFSSISCLGVEGKQGPYFLVREGRMVSESEVIYLDGRLLKRGDDYYIDYEFGSVTFTNKNLITNRTRIEADFQSALYAYPLLLNSVDGFYSNETFLKSGVVLLREYHNPDEPLFFELTPEEKNYLAGIGDDSSRAFRSGVDSTGGDYEKVDNYFVYVGQDSGRYKINFSYAGEGQGEYVYDRTIHAFRYVGAGQGSYLPRTPLPLPTKNEFYAGQLGFRDLVNLEYYLSREDRNLFSSLDDDDNRGQGFDLGFNLSEKNYFIKANQLYLDDNFVYPGRKYEVDYRYKYNLQDELRTKTEFSGGVKPFGFLGFKAGYGLVNSTHRRITGESNIFCTRFGLELLDEIKRYYAGIDTGIGWARLHSLYKQERYRWTPGRTWTIENQVALKPFSPLELRVGYDHERDTVGTGKTRRAGFSFADILETDLGIRDYIQDRYIFATVRTRIFTRFLNLNAALEKTNTAIQKLDEIYRPVEPGKGNYVKDPITGEYIPKQGGDYIKEIVRLEEFEKIDAYRYNLTAQSAPSEGLEIGGSLDGVDEELYTERNINPWLSLQPTGDLSLDITGRYLTTLDMRYYGRFEVDDGELSLDPRFKGLKGHFAYFNNRQWLNRLLEETRKGYQNWLIQDIRLKLDWWVKGGYNRIAIEMPYYYPSLGLFYLYEPNTGIGVSYPISKRGRIDIGSEFLYRQASIDSLPFSLQVESPVGLTQTYNLSGSYNMTDYTIIFAHYRGEKLPAERLRHDFRAEVKIRF